MLAELIDVSGWSHEQWLAVSILAFVGIAILVILHRLYKLFKMGRRQRYQPNLRPLRRKVPQRLKQTENLSGESKENE